jgi:hypothetical protein
MAGSPQHHVRQHPSRSGRSWINWRNLLILCGFLLLFHAFGGIGTLKALTYSKRVLRRPNPTVYLFHVPATQIRSALPRWCPVTPCPPTPTPCLILNSPTDGTKYDLVQLDRTKSDTYRWFGTTLEYKADYLLTVTPESDSQTKVEISTSKSNVLLATNVGIHGGDYLAEVAPTTIEEYRYLLMIGSKVGEHGMPSLRLPQ